MHKNLKFKLLFFVSLALENTINPLSSTQLGDVSYMEISPSIVVIYLVCEDLCNQIPPKKRKLYDSSQKFQDAWIAHLPWEKSIVDEKGLVQHVTCNICTLKGKKKCLHQSWIAHLSMLDVQTLRFLC